MFQCPDRSNPEPFSTNYRVIIGNGAIFEKARCRRLGHYRRHVVYRAGARIGQGGSLDQTR